MPDKHTWTTDEDRLLALLCCHTTASWKDKVKLLNESFGNHFTERSGQMRWHNLTRKKASHVETVQKMSTKDQFVQDTLAAHNLSWKAPCPPTTGWTDEQDEILIVLRIFTDASWDEIAEALRDRFIIPCQAKQASKRWTSVQQEKAVLVYEIATQFRVTDPWVSDILVDQGLDPRDEARQYSPPSHHLKRRWRYSAEQDRFLAWYRQRTTISWKQLVEIFNVQFAAAIPIARNDAGARLSGHYYHLQRKHSLPDVAGLTDAWARVEAFDGHWRSLELRRVPPYELKGLPHPVSPATDAESKTPMAQAPEQHREQRLQCLHTQNAARTKEIEQMNADLVRRFSLLP